MTQSDASQYYQWRKNSRFPIFIQLIGKIGNSSAQQALKLVGFELLTQAEFEGMSKTLFEHPQYRLLKIEAATPRVATQMGHFTESDYYGPESVTPHNKYNLYRFKGNALMIYSFAYREWSMGVKSKFFDASNKFVFQSVLNRYLSLSLGPFKIVGFWGRTIDGGVVVTKQKDSLGEAVFFDLTRYEQYNASESRSLDPDFTLHKLDKDVLMSKNMSREELFSFLVVHNTFLDANGISGGLRGLIQQLSTSLKGKLHPQRKFLEKSDLSI